MNPRYQVLVDPHVTGLDKDFGPDEKPQAIAYAKKLRAQFRGQEGRYTERRHSVRIWDTQNNPLSEYFHIGGR